MSETQNELVEVAVIGGGPAGLAAAEAAARAGRRVVVFERMPTLGRKLLMAGKSGLNLTNAAPDLPARYTEGAERLGPILEGRGAQAVRDWAEGLGQETFVGSSGRVFPRAMKASPLLRAWIARLASLGVETRTRWRWSGWDEAGLDFETSEGARRVRARATVLALGGASWPRLGSDAGWVGALQAAGAPFTPFQPSNAGVEIEWSAVFRERFGGAPLKTLALTVGGARRRGECVVAGYGLEGGVVYALTPMVRAALAAGAASLTLDLAPDRSEEALAQALARPRGKQSAANWLRKSVGLEGAEAGLLREPGPLPTEPAALAARIKALRLPILRARPIQEAISTAGGVGWDGLDDGLMLTARPGVFCAGEMIDWDAPTGGYLLTACLATGWKAGAAAAAWVGATA